MKTKINLLTTLVLFLVACSISAPVIAQVNSIGFTKNFSLEEWTWVHDADPPDIEGQTWPRGRAKLIGVNDSLYNEINDWLDDEDVSQHASVGGEANWDFRSRSTQLSIPSFDPAWGTLQYVELKWSATNNTTFTLMAIDIKTIEKWAPGFLGISECTSCATGSAGKNCNDAAREFSNDFVARDEWDGVVETLFGDINNAAEDINPCWAGYSHVDPEDPQDPPGWQVVIEGEDTVGGRISEWSIDANALADTYTTMVFQLPGISNARTDICAATNSNDECTGDTWKVNPALYHQVRCAESYGSGKLTEFLYGGDWGQYGASSAGNDEYYEPTRYTTCTSGIANPDKINVRLAASMTTGSDGQLNGTDLSEFECDLEGCGGEDSFVTKIQQYVQATLYCDYSGDSGKRHEDSGDICRLEVKPQLNNGKVEVVYTYDGDPLVDVDSNGIAHPNQQAIARGQAVGAAAFAPEAAASSADVSSTEYVPDNSPPIGTLRFASADTTEPASPSKSYDVRIETGVDQSYQCWTVSEDGSLKIEDEALGTLRLALRPDDLGSSTPNWQAVSTYLVGGRFSYALHGKGNSQKIEGDMIRHDTFNGETQMYSFRGDALQYDCDSW